MKKLIPLLLAAVLLTGCGTTQADAAGNAVVGAGIAANKTSTGLNPGDEVSVTGVSNNFALRSLDFLDENTGFVIETRSAGGPDVVTAQLLKTTDGGSHWSKIGTEGNALSQVKFISQDIGWAISRLDQSTDSGGDTFRCAVLHTEDGGASWATQWQGEKTSDAKEDMWFADRSTGFVLAGGLLLSTRDGGATWTAVSFSQPDFIPQSVSFSDAETGWIMGTDGGKGSVEVFKTADGGKTWTCQFTKSYSGNQTGCVGIDFADAETGWFLTSDMSSWNGELCYTNDGGSHWNLINRIKSIRPTPMSIRFVNTQIGWIPLDVGAGPIAGGLMFTKDGGKTFQMAGRAASDESGETQKITDASEVDFITPERGWAVGIDPNTGGGNFLVSTSDGGETWEQMLPEPEPTRDVTFVDNQTGFGIAVQSDNSALLETSDGGGTWKYIRSFTGEYWPEKLTFVDSQNGWMAVTPESGINNGAPPEILKTSDGGKTWTNLSSLPPYIEIIYFRFFDAENGLVLSAGTSGRLFRTRDGGKTWDSSAKEMPENGLDQYAFRDLENGWVLCNPGNYKTSYDVSISRMTDGTAWQPLSDIAPGSASYVLTVQPNGKLMALVEEPPYQQNSRIKLMVSDDGKTWKPHPMTEGFNSLTFGSIQTMQFTDDSNGWILTMYGLLATRDGGRTWTWK